MQVIHVSPELTPLAKAGGLGDVVTGLSKAQLSQGTDVLLILPYYSHIPWKHSNTKAPVFSSSIREGEKEIPFQVFSSHYGELSLHLVHLEDVDYLLRNSIYGELDDNDRFLAYCLAVEKYLETFTSPLIIHTHDWTCAPLISFCKSNKKLQSHRYVLTIHNLLHQGKCSVENLMKAHRHHLKKDFTHPSDPKHLYLLLGGITQADHITTVSPTYAKEILTEKFGYGLEKILKERREKITGILNGLDYDYWNPTNDPFIPKQLKNLEDKKSIATLFREKYGFQPSDQNLYCIVSRLTQQKGPEFMLAAAEYLLSKNQQVFILGAADRDFMQRFHFAQKKYENNPNIYFHLEFSEEISHQVFAASDFLLIPSIFEPCGLTQLIGYRFLCIPIAFATGGLKDTIIDFRQAPQNGTGLLFNEYSLQDFFSALDASAKLSPTEKNQLVDNIDSLDFSWKESARKYLKLYRELF